MFEHKLIIIILNLFLLIYFLKNLFWEDKETEPKYLKLNSFIFDPVMRSNRGVMN